MTARSALRLAVVLASMCIVVITTNRFVRGPDLTRGRPWRISSSYPGFSGSDHRVDGSPTDVFFHTNGDASPWFEVDLGEGAQFSRVEVENRDDDYRARALPLLVEVSDDTVSWRAVARRGRPFRVWIASFSTVHTRYLRLRVPRRSFLHLVRVAVYR